MKITAEIFDTNFGGSRFLYFIRNFVCFLLKLDTNQWSQ